jgi:hypothetical protein
MARLGLIGDEASRFDFELAVGRLRAVEAAMRELDALRRDDGVDEHLAQRLAQRYAQECDHLRQALDTMYHSDEALGAQEELEVERRLLRVQRQAVRDAYARGLLSAAVERELASAIDRDLAQLDPAARDD